MNLVPWSRGPRPSQLLTSWEALAALEPDWDRLWQASPRARRLCLSFRWVRALVAFFDGQRGTETRPWCVVLRDETGHPTGIAPLIVEEGSGGRRVRTLPDWVERNHGFLCAGPVAPLAREVRRHLDGAGGDGLRLRGLLRQEALALVDAWEGSGRVTALRISQAEGKDGAPGSTWWDRRAITLAPTWEEWLAGRGGNYRSSLKRAWKRARKEARVDYWRHSGGRQVCGEPLAPDELLAILGRIEARAWQGEQHFAPQGDGRTMLETLLGQGLLELSLLWLDGKPVSYVMGHTAGRGATTRWLGFDPDFAALSPGILTLAELVRTSCEERRLDEINLRGSDHQYKAQMADAIESSFELELFGRTPRGLATALARRARPGLRALGPEALRLLASPEPLDGRAGTADALLSALVAPGALELLEAVAPLIG